jgi:type II secretory pathway pseudopilin PulG
MSRNDSTQFCGVVPRCTDERGMALIIVLVMLLLLSILGVTMLSSTTSDLHIAGNNRNSTETFYAADAAMAFAQTYDQIYLSLGSGMTSWPQSGAGTPLDSNFAVSGTNPNTAIPLDPSGNYNRILIPGTNDVADVQVVKLGTGTLPAGLGTQQDAGLSPGTSFKANSFVINVIAYGPNNSKAQLESQLCRIVQQ